jgi:hypothetical protein
MGFFPIPTPPPTFPKKVMLIFMSSGKLKKSFHDVQSVHVGINKEHLFFKNVKGFPNFC